MYHHWCTNTVRQDVMTIKSFTLAPIFLGSSVWNFLSCHPSGAQNFVLAAGSLEIFSPLCTTHFNKKGLLLYRILVIKDKSDFSIEDIPICFVN